MYEVGLKQFRPLPSSKSKWVWDPDNTTALKLSILEGRHGSQRKDRKKTMVETLRLNNLVTMCTAKIRKEEIICPFCQDFIQVLSTPWSLPSSPEVVGGQRSPWLPRQTFAPTCAGRFSSGATSVKPPTVSSVKNSIQRQQEQCGESDVIIYMDVQFAKGVTKCFFHSISFWPNQ